VLFVSCRSAFAHLVSRHPPGHMTQPDVTRSHFLNVKHMCCVVARLNLHNNFEQVSRPPMSSSEYFWDLTLLEHHLTIIYHHISLKQKKGYLVGCGGGPTHYNPISQGSLLTFDVLLER